MIRETDDPVLLMEPVTAWRVWRAARIADQWRLFSVRGSVYSQPTVWEPHRPLEARHVDVEHAFGYRAQCGDFNGANDTFDHESPCAEDTHLGCWGCGIYGIKSSYPNFLFDVASEWAQSTDCIDPDTVTILGMVSLWGRIVEHAFGYRAQYGYPKAICDYGLVKRRVRSPFYGRLDTDAVDRTTRGVREIADTYGIPIIPNRSDES